MVAGVVVPRPSSTSASSSRSVVIIGVLIGAVIGRRRGDPRLLRRYCCCGCSSSRRRRFTTKTTTATTTSTTKRRRQIHSQQRNYQTNPHHAKIQSFGWSGAGFLAAYHLGVAKCLLDHNILPCSSVGSNETNTSDDNESFADKKLKMVGVSAGALLSAAIAVGIDPCDGMNAVLKVNQQTRRSYTAVNTGDKDDSENDPSQSSLLPFSSYMNNFINFNFINFDVLHPGFSLVDVVEDEFGKLCRNAIAQKDNDWFLNRINGGSALRIGLTDRRVFPPLGHNPPAFCYVDKYRNVDDLIAAAILSSYIPGLTGPLRGTLDSQNQAVNRATQRLNDMIRSGCVKRWSDDEVLTMLPADEDGEGEDRDGTDGETTESASNSNNTSREYYWDGGLVNAFPYYDNHTVIVSPVAANFPYGNPSINPSLEYCSSSTYDNGSNNPVRVVQINPHVQVHLTTANAIALRQIALSSEDDVLESKYNQGYDNAHTFLKERNLLSVFTSSTSTSKSTKSTTI